MAKSKIAWPVLLVAALLVGGLLGAFAFPMTNEVIVEKQVEVIKEVPVNVEVEVEKVVEVANMELKLNEALELWLEEFDEDEDLLVCGGNEFDESQVEVVKVYDDWALELSDDEEEITFTVKMKYLDGDVENKCYETFDVEVTLEDDEDAEVDWDLA